MKSKNTWKHVTSALHDTYYSLLLGIFHWTSWLCCLFTLNNDKNKNKKKWRYLNTICRFVLDMNVNMNIMNNMPGMKRCVEKKSSYFDPKKNLNLAFVFYIQSSAVSTVVPQSLWVLRALEFWVSPSFEGSRVLRAPDFEAPSSWGPCSVHQFWGSLKSRQYSNFLGHFVKKVMTGHVIYEKP